MPTRFALHGGSGFRFDTRRTYASDHAVPTALTEFQTVSSTISVVPESECRPVLNQVLDQTSQLGGPHRLLQKSEPGNFCLFSYIHFRVPTDQAGGTE